MQTKFRGRLLIGMFVGALVGVMLPYDSIEYHVRGEDQKVHFLHIVNGAVIGTIVAMLIDLRTMRFADIKRFSLRQLFLIVTIAAVAAWAVAGYIAILRYRLN